MSLLRWRRDHVVDTDRDAGLRRVQEAHRLEIVEHLDGHLVAQLEMAEGNQRLQAFLLQRAVDERQAVARQTFVKDDAADGRVDHADRRLPNCSHASRPADCARASGRSGRPASEA